MDPAQYQQILDYSQRNSKLQVSLNSGGNVVMLPVVHMGEATSPTDSLSQHVTTHIITPEQLQAAAVDQPSSLYQQTPADQGDVYKDLVLGEADENLADLQPEDSDGEDDDNERPHLTPEQKKLEFMAAVNLVPPAVLEEIQRRQKLCRAEYGNWWDRQHSTDFCLVPKSSSALNKLHTVTEDEPTESYDAGSGDEYQLMTVSDDHTQVAAGPDAESMVEQITYLTSWPAASPPAPGPTHTVEVVTTPTANHTHQHVGGASMMEDRGYQISFQSIEEYASQ